jgi:transposase
MFAEWLQQFLSQSEAEGKGKKGFPRFKRKHQKQSFRIK